MADYKIKRISQKEPRKWHSDTFNSDTYYILVQLEGVDRSVEIGKKNPDALKVGDIVSGTIQPKPDYEADGFKADPKPFGGGGGKSNFQPKDEEAIARAVALKAAVDSLSPDSGVEVALKVADEFLAWLKLRPEAPKSDEPRHEPVDESF